MRGVQNLTPLALHAERDNRELSPQISFKRNLNFTLLMGYRGKSSISPVEYPPFDLPPSPHVYLLLSEMPLLRQTLKKLFLYETNGWRSLC
jgi:hypothetical protein